MQRLTYIGQQPWVCWDLVLVKDLVIFSTVWSCQPHWRSPSDIFSWIVSRHSPRATCGRHPLPWMFRARGVESLLCEDLESQRYISWSEAIGKDMLICQHQTDCAWYSPLKDYLKISNTASPFHCAFALGRFSKILRLRVTNETTTRTSHKLMMVDAPKQGVNHELTYSFPVLASCRRTNLNALASHENYVGSSANYYRENLFGLGFDDWAMKSTAIEAIQAILSQAAGIEAIQDYCQL